MKNLIRKSLLIATLFVALVVNATTIDANHNVTIAGTKLISLQIDNSDGVTTINVIDNFGTILFNDVFKGENYLKKYDLSTLPAGSYTIKLNGSTKITYIPFNISENSVEVKESVIFVKPSIRIKNDKVYVSHLSLIDKKMEITVFDADSNVIYNEKLSGRMDLGKVLNFSKLEEGIYTVVVNAEGNVFEKVIKKEKGNLF